MNKQIDLPAVESFFLKAFFAAAAIAYILVGDASAMAGIPAIIVAALAATSLSLAAVRLLLTALKVEQITISAGQSWRAPVSVRLVRAKASA